MEGELLSKKAVDYSGGAPGVSHTLSSYTYDALYRVTSLTDGNGNTTKYTYSPTTGHLILTQYPGAGTNTSGTDTIQTPSYDAEGNLLTRIDGNGVTTSTLYDDLSSLPTKVHYTYPVGYAGTQIADVSAAYDVYGRHASTTDGVYVASGSNPGEKFTYDDLDNVLSRTVNYASSGSLSNLQVFYTYWVDGTRGQMIAPHYTGAAGLALSTATTTPIAGTRYGATATMRRSGVTTPTGGSRPACCATPAATLWGRRRTLTTRGGS